MQTEFVIKFGKSASQNYQKAINLSKKFSNFSPVSPKNIINQILIDENELRLKFKYIESLWLIIGNWKSTELFINGESADFNELRKYFSVIECGNNYYKAIIPEDHCKLYGQREGWTCKFLNTISRYFPNSAYEFGKGHGYWFQFGHFRKPTIWKIDKKRLKNALSRESELKKVKICPIFDFKKIEKIISELPNEIDLEKTDDWVLRYEENVSGLTIEKKPLSIMPKALERQYVYSIGIDTRNQNVSVEENQKEIAERRNIPTVRYDDIGGIDDIIDKIREVVELPLKHPEILEYLGVKSHKGILLYGPAGCGKTLIAKAIANEVKAHFIAIKGPELFSKWFGQSEENLRRIFEEARDLQPSIIFFDEIDSIAQKRSEEEQLRIESRFVNQLLTLMDGIEDFGNVCVIASTNMPELIDEALLRPGRFDYHIEVTKPTRKGCFKIFSIHIKNMPISKNFNIHKFSEKLEGLTGADIAYVAREGAYNCLRRSIDIKSLVQSNLTSDVDFQKMIITEEDFFNALKDIKHVM